MQQDVGDSRSLEKIFLGFCLESEVVLISTHLAMPSGTQVRDARDKQGDNKGCNSHFTFSLSL